MAKLSETYKLGMTRKIPTLESSNGGGSNTAPVSYNSGKLSETYKLGANTYQAPEVVFRKVPSMEKQPSSTPSVDFNAIINEYESLPNTNVFSRMFSTKAKDAYNRKQELNPLYEQAKDAQTRQRIADLGLSEDVVRKAYEEGWGYGGGQLTDLLKSKGVSDRKERDELYRSIDKMLTRKAQSEASERNIKLADEHPVIGSALTVPGKMVTGFGGAVETGVNYLAGNPLSNTSGSLAANKTMNEMRGKVSEDMSGLGKFAYSTGMSLADMIAARNLGALPAILGFEKASDTINESIDQGLNPGQIMDKGVLSGATTYLTEKLISSKALDEAQEGILHLLKEGGIKALGKEGLKKILLPLLVKSGIAEGIQEGSENVADTLADLFIARGKNEIKQTYDRYKAEGLADEQAALNVARDKAVELGLDVAGGFVSGFLGGGAEMGKSVANYTINNRNSLPKLGQTNQAVTENNETPSAKIPTVEETKTLEKPKVENTVTPIPEKAEILSIAKETMPKNSKEYTDYEIVTVHRKGGKEAYVPKGIDEKGTLYSIGSGAVKTREEAQQIIENYKKNLNSTDAKADDIPKLEEPKRERDTYMLEDIGLNDHAEDYDNGTATITVDARNLDGVPNIKYDNQQTTKTARNTLEKFYSQNDEAYERHVKNVYDEKYQYEIKNIKQVDDGARNTIVKYGTDSVYEDVMRDGIKTIDDFAKARNLQNWYEEQGDYAKVDLLSQKISQSLTPAAQMLRYCQVYGDSAMGVSQATDALAGQKTKSFVNDAEAKTGKRKNKEQLEINKKLASALNQIGKDTQTEVQGMPPKSYEEILTEVKNTISSSKYNERLTDSDAEYLARLITNGATTADLLNALNRHFATGYFGMSQEDMEAIKDIYKRADEAKTSKERFELKMQAAAIASKYLGNATFMDKWNAWRYLAMLGNPRTWIRNKLGNRSFGFVTNVKDNVAALIENAVIKDGEGRTKAILNKKTDADLIDASDKDFDNYAYERVAGTSKWSMKSSIENARRIYNSNLLEGARNFTNNKLEGDDIKAIHRKYTRALAGYLKANGADANIFEQGGELLDKARAYAIEQAKIATFHDDNKVADVLNKWSKDARKMGGVAGKALEMGIESTMPFKKTPLNVLKQGVVEYSPAQLLKAAYQIKTKQDASRWIDSLAKGLTGSTIMALGYALGSAGLLVGQVDDDDDDVFNKGSNYSIKLPNGTSFTIDWLAPAALPLFVGNELSKFFDGELNSPADFVEALASVGEPAVELSMLEGLDNVLSALANIKGAKLAPTIGNIAAGYASQAIPTLLGQVARTVDPYRRSTRTSDSSSKAPAVTALEKAGEKAINKIPGLSMTNQKYIDIWGNPQKNANGLFGGNLVGRAVQNFVSPGYFNDVSMTDREAKLATLESTFKENGYEGSLIPSIAKSNKPDGTRMTNAEYESFAKTRGQELGRAVDAALRYQRQTSVPQLQKYVKQIENFANFVAERKEFNKSISDTYKKAYEAYQLGGYDGVMTYYMMDDQSDLDGNGSVTHEELAEWLRKSDVPAKKREDYFMIKFPKAKKIPSLK